MIVFSFEGLVTYRTVIPLPDAEAGSTTRGIDEAAKSASSTGSKIGCRSIKTFGGKSFFRA